jgi:hypothetical protein
MASRKFYVPNPDAVDRRSSLFMLEKREQAGSYIMACELAGLVKTYNVFRFKSEYGDFQWMVDRSDHPALDQCDTLSSARTTVIRDMTALRFPPK